MKVLFIITPEDEEEKYSIKLSSNIGLYIPLAVAQIAAILEKDKHEVRVLDIRLFKSKRINEVFRNIKEFRPDAVAFSISLFSASKIFSISKLIKYKYSIPIILGGPYATIFSKKIMEEQPSIDVVVYGEGFFAFSDILKALKENKDLKDVKGIYYRKKKEIIKTRERLFIADLDKLPFAAMHLFNINKYIPYPKHYKKLPILPMITSRGCTWNNCTFCYHPKSRQYIRQSPSRVVNEIKCAVKRYNIKEIRFWDDNFINGEKWIFEFCNLLEKENLNIIWSCHARAKGITKEILQKIAKAGCWQIFYGAESGNQNILNKIKKGITLNEVKNAVKLAKEAGLEVRVSFMLGFPEETPEMTQNTIKFASELDADYIQFSLVTPYPGTEMYEKLNKSGIIDKNIENYCEYKVVLIPKGYKNKEELEKKFKEAYRKAYLNPEYIWKSIRKIKTLDDAKRYLNGFKVVLNFLRTRKNISK